VEEGRGGEEEMKGGVFLSFRSAMIIVAITRFSSYWGVKNCRFGCSQWHRAEKLFANFEL